MKQVCSRNVWQGGRVAVGMGIGKYLTLWEILWEWGELKFHSYGNLMSEQIWEIFILVSTTPLNLVSDNITFASFCVTFEPPTNIDQNGPITSYTVTYRGELFNTTEYNTTVSVNTVVYPLTESSSMCISDLEEYNNYTVLIRANNGAGEGAAAIITIRTSETGSLTRNVRL